MDGTEPMAADTTGYVKPQWYLRFFASAAATDLELGAVEPQRTSVLRRREAATCALRGFEARVALRGFGALRTRAREFLGEVADHSFVNI